MNVTWKKSGETGLAHACDRKGGLYYITLCHVAIAAGNAQDAQPGDEHCQTCELSEGRRHDDAKQTPHTTAARRFQPIRNRLRQDAGSNGQGHLHHAARPGLGKV